MERMEDVIEGKCNGLIMLLEAQVLERDLQLVKVLDFQRCSIDSIEGSALYIH
jgi:hypothetical protein